MGTYSPLALAQERRAHQWPLGLSKQLNGAQEFVGCTGAAPTRQSGLHSLQ